MTLPAPVVEAWEWQLRARCRTCDVDFFGDTTELVDRAKSVCTGCPVQEECRWFAARAGETHGVWGGVSAEELPRYRWLPPPRSLRRAHRDHTAHFPRGHTA
ncbi:WhiB family transcriptional regulator [Rhodococcus sp. NPDC003318]|uniref:WhiB family transcriptional regulator n=1 Tax=Rhodococcus sp. NPDC003318 TaxID=3364503 RepID=UPI0036CD2C1D